MAESTTKPAQPQQPQQPPAGVRPQPTGPATAVAVPKPNVSPINPNGAAVTPAAAAAVKPLPATPAPQVQQAVVQGPPFRITAAGSQSTWLNLLVYAQFGAGKTRLGLSAVEVPSMNDVFLANIEGGDLTLRGAFDVPSEVDQVRITDFAQLARLYEVLRSHCTLRDQNNEAGLRKLEAWLKGVPESEIIKPKRYRTVIIDSLTEAEAYLMYQLLGVTTHMRLDEEAGSPEWAEYKKQHNMMQRLIRSFRDLPMHTVFICSRGWVQDEQKRFNYGPQMTGKLSNAVQGFVDIVGYLDVQPTPDGKLARTLWVQPVGRFAAKCRFSNYKLPYFQNPNLKSILQAVGLLQMPAGAPSVEAQQAALPVPPTPDSSPPKEGADLEKAPQEQAAQPAKS
jgi:hypothetical protein